MTKISTAGPASQAPLRTSSSRSLAPLPRRYVTTLSRTCGPRGGGRQVSKMDSDHTHRAPAALQVQRCAARARAGRHPPGAGCTSCPSAGRPSSRTAAAGDGWNDGDSDTSWAAATHQPRRTGRRAMQTWQVSQQAGRQRRSKHLLCTSSCRSAARRWPCAQAGHSRVEWLVGHVP